MDRRAFLASAAATAAAVSSLSSEVLTAPAPAARDVEDVAAAIGVDPAVLPPAAVALLRHHRFDPGA